MTLDELDRLMDDPRFVSGIHNYCDRWCERCPFTNRCLNFAMEDERMKRRGRTESHSDIENADFWDELHETFETTAMLLRQMAEEMGIDLENVDVSEEMEIHYQRAEEAEHHDLAERSMAYIKQVDQWFKEAEPLFKQRGEQLESMVRMNIPGVDVEGSVIDLSDAVEVIRWYYYFIHVKLQRAVHSKLDEDAETDEEMRAFPKDSEGTAKIALIAMDRSIGAWGRLLKAFPECETETLELLVHLDRLRRATEQEFPNARKFVRPGLDTISLLED